MAKATRSTSGPNAEQQTFSCAGKRSSLFVFFVFFFFVFFLSALGSRRRPRSRCLKSLLSS